MIKVKIHHIYYSSVSMYDIDFDDEGIEFVSI